MTKTPDKVVAGIEFTACETMTAISSHIRQVGGGTDTKTLCGKKAAWDCRFQPEFISCPICIKAYEEILSRPSAPEPEPDPLSDAHPGWKKGAHSGMTFEEIHEAGVRQFGSPWVGANRVAVDAFINCGVSPGSPELSKALSLVVFRVLEGVWKS